MWYDIQRVFLLESFPIFYTTNVQMVAWKLELPERETELHLNQNIREENTGKAIKNRSDCLTLKLLLSYISQSKFLSSF